MPAKLTQSTPFLKSVHLKGFKSIEDLSVVFENGLNILIGKNASGKSNFLECLYQTMSFSSAKKLSYNYANIKFLIANNQTLEIDIEKELINPIIERDNFDDLINFNERLYLNNNLIFDNLFIDDSKKIIEYLGEKTNIGSTNVRGVLRRLGLNVIIAPLYIKFNLPLDLGYIDVPGNITINSNDLFWETSSTLSFLKDLLWKVELQFADESNDIENRIINRKNILKNLKIRKDIVENLKKFTPIENIRFNENINIYSDEKSTTIENIKIDFKINNRWMPWSQLSDGTKRLFYIISEITNRRRGLILVEEPELGIHPHQFNLIMEFLKEESNQKQIIISTHSPYALNHLTPDELSNILITYYDNKKGTQIKHLTPSQIKKAKAYIKEVGFFSDYWMLSDLE